MTTDYANLIDAIDRLERERSEHDETRQMVSEALRQAAEQSGASYAELARAAGEYRANIQQWLSGRRLLPLRSLRKIAKKLSEGD